MIADRFDEFLIIQFVVQCAVVLVSQPWGGERVAARSEIVTSCVVSASYRLWETFWGEEKFVPFLGTTIIKMGLPFEFR